MSVLVLADVVCDFDKGLESRADEDVVVYGVVGKCWLCVSSGALYVYGV